jgi:hypothetical protein
VLLERHVHLGQRLVGDGLDDLAGDDRLALVERGERRAVRDLVQRGAAHHLVRRGPAFVGAVEVGAAPARVELREERLRHAAVKRAVFRQPHRVELADAHAALSSA